MWCGLRWYWSCAIYRTQTDSKHAAIMAVMFKWFVKSAFAKKECKEDCYFVDVSFEYCIKMGKIGLVHHIGCFLRTLHWCTTYIHIKSKDKGSIHFFVVITELSSYIKWLVSLPPTPGDFSFSTSILITLMKMIKFTWITESKQGTLRNFGVYNNF